MPDLKTMQGQAVDLNKAVEQRDAERAKDETAALEAAGKRVEHWQRAMRRTFKGIFPGSTRRAFMRAYAAQSEREGK